MLLQFAAALSVHHQDDVAHAAPVIRDAGFNLVQLDLLWPDWSEADVERWMDILQEHDIEVGAVGCYANLLRPREVSSMGASLAHLLRAIELGPLFGARKFIAWSGTLATGLFDSLPDNHSGKGALVMADTLLDLLPVLEDNDAQLVVEPHFNHYVNTPEDAQSFIGGVPQSRVTLVCDPINFIRPKEVDRCDALVAHAVAALAHHTAVIHLKDIAHGTEAHPAYTHPGGGLLDYTMYLAELDAIRAPLLAVIENTPLERLAEVKRWVMERLPE